MLHRQCLGLVLLHPVGKHNVSTPALLLNLTLLVLLNLARFCPPLAVSDLA
jgi:hypothetical protein